MNIGKCSSEKFKINELSKVVKKKRNVSQPGPNRIMNCTFRIMFIAVRDKVIPLKWNVSDGMMISKVLKPRQSNLADYGQIALGNVEGKLFWSLIPQRFYQHLVPTGL